MTPFLLALCAARNSVLGVAANIALSSARIAGHALIGFEHTEHRVATVMLCKTCHQLQHHDPSFFLPTNMVFGNWVEFLQRYQRGVSRDIYYKILHTLKKELTMYDPSEKRALQLLSIANTLEDWSAKNAYFFGESGINM